MDLYLLLCSPVCPAWFLKHYTHSIAFIGGSKEYRSTADTSPSLSLNLCLYVILYSLSCPFTSIFFLTKYCILNVFSHLLFTSFELIIKLNLIKIRSLIAPDYARHNKTGSNQRSNFNQIVIKLNIYTTRWRYICGHQMQTYFRLFVIIDSFLFYVSLVLSCLSVVKHYA